MSSSKFFRSGELQGKTVIETTGNHLGKAKDIGFNLEGTTMLFIQKDDGSEASVPTSKLIAIGEFVVVRSEAAQPAAMAAVTLQTVPAPPRPAPVQAVTAVVPPALLCKNCGAPLKPGSRFCTKCGASAL